MNLVSRPPTLPPDPFLGRPEGAGRPALPPIRPLAASQHHQEGSSLPPLQLPPLQTTSCGPGPPIPPAAPHVSRPLSITQLLSQPSPPPAPALPRLPHVYHTPPSGYGPPPHEARSSHSYAATAQHRLNQPPATAGFRHPPPPAPGTADPYARYADPDHSPAITSNSSAAARSYFGSEEPSPRPSIPSTANFLAPPSTSTTAGHIIISHPPPLDYHLSLRQQPAAARACGFGERDRRVIDPPPILELKITDRDANPAQDLNGILALHCTLLSPDGRDDETELPSTQQAPSQRRLMGTLVASPYQAKDEAGVAGTFFVFPDLSCRSPGKYRLRFKLLRIDPAHMLPGMSSPSVATIVTDVFSVYTAKDFPGMRASSALLKSLRRQGLNVGVKKGSEARKGRGKAKKESSSDEEDEEEDERESSDDGEREGEGERRGSGDTGSTSGVSPRTQPRKKSKRKRRMS